MKAKKVPSRSLESCCRRAVALGARSAKVIPTSRVVTAPWVRMKCQFGCGGFGGCLTCPPYSPTPEQMRRILDSYRRAVLVHVDDRQHDLKGLVVKLEREMFLAGYYKAWGLGSGPCRLCEVCNLKKCKHPGLARPSMESTGIDVYATARGNGFHIDVVRNHSSPQDYYGLVLAE